MKSRIYIGCCGFPISMKKYFQIFNCVEIQQTFYKILDKKILEKWRSLAPKDFVFSVKAFQGITHPINSPTWKRSNIKLSGNEQFGFLRPNKDVFNFWNKMLEVCEILNAKVCLIQLPQSFKDNEENIYNAEKFFSSIERRNVKIAIELRGWSEKNVKSLCKKFDLIHCVDILVSKPLHFGKDSTGYFRLHGKYENGKIIYKHNYSEEELNKLKNIINKLKCNEVFCFFNNSYMFENAKRFLEIYSL